MGMTINEAKDVFLNRGFVEVDGGIVFDGNKWRESVVVISEFLENYETRLKADMVAMLTELQLELEENTVRWYVGRVDGKSDDVVLMETINDIIQQKINALKENTDEKD